MKNKSQKQIEELERKYHWALYYAIFSAFFFVLFLSLWVIGLYDIESFRDKLSQCESGQGNFSLYKCLDEIKNKYGEVSLFSIGGHPYRILVRECMAEYCKTSFYEVGENCEVLE